MDGHEGLISRISLGSAVGWIARDGCACVRVVSLRSTGAQSVRRGEAGELDCAGCVPVCNRRNGGGGTGARGQQCQREGLSRSPGSVGA